MKINRITLILSAGCAAWLFAQAPVEMTQSGQPAADDVPVVVDEAAALADDVPAVTNEAPAVTGQMPAAAEDMPAVAEEVSIAAQDTPAAEAEETDAASEDAAEVDQIGISDEMDAGSTMSDDLVSLSLKDVELQDVVRMFSRLSGVNIIVPDLTQGQGEGQQAPKRIDVNLENVEWKPALQAILDTQGLELIEKIPGSEVYGIRKRPADAPEPVETKVYRLNYAGVDEVVKMISSLVQKYGGQISTYPARNSIVAQGTARMLNDLEEIIEKVDLPRQQVFIEAKFMELSDSASEQLGIDWSVLGGYKVGVSGISGNYAYEQNRTDNINKFSDISGRPYESIESAEEPTYVENPNTGISDFYNGIDLEGRPGSTGNNVGRIFGIIPTREAIDSSVVGQTLGATLNADDFQLVLSALRDINGTKVVSNPKVIVANEETAMIHIGAKKPNIKGTTQTAGDSQSTTTYALDTDEPYFEDGIMVEVTPTVNTLDNISVQINPTLDRLDNIPTAAPDGTLYYGKTTKTISTRFSMKNGQTAAIGGLTEASSSDVDRKVPLLGSLPLIGRLFSYRSTNESQVETIIFVTLGLANPTDINMETGLPEDSNLAMRHEAKTKTERAIKEEQLKILQNVESDRLQEQLKKLREEEAKRLNKIQR